MGTVAQVAAFAVYGDLVLLMNGENVVSTAHQTELADLIIELAAGNIDQDSFIDSYVEMLDRGDQAL